MKEKLYTIPVTDAFNSDCECPICSMYKNLEEDSINYTIGPSYMEDDVRAETDKVGFCAKHVKNLYEKNNLLGLALMMKTHLDKTNSDLKKLTTSPKERASSFFKKVSSGSSITEYINKLEKSCFICKRIDSTFNRYIVTIFHLYKTEDNFKELFSKSKGFCTKHYGVLYESAHEYLSGEKLSDFIKLLNTLYLDNMNRIADDVAWFINKFDYKYENEPWKNAKDALPRALTKTNGLI